MELSRYKLDLVGVQEFMLDQRDNVRAGDYIFLLWKENENQLGKGILYTKEEYQQLRE